MRIGHGYDVHRFQSGEFITLGGVQIRTLKFCRHSDAILISSAVASYLCVGSIRRSLVSTSHDTDPAYKGADSRQLLRNVVKFVEQRAGGIAMGQHPDYRHRKWHRIIALMRENIAADLKIALEQVNVKATTTEGLGLGSRGRHCRACGCDFG